ncbi:E3 ubiquitin-protein ligase BRE1A [Hordeum vulgare]|nr:E3 ubiquitin-protein ligase BRE1A [Hordeum vulgare]
MSNTSGARRAARRQLQDGSADKVVVDLDASSPVAGNPHGLSVFPGARTSPIDVEALDDEVQALSPSQVPPPGVNRRTRGQPVTPFSLDEDAILEENWRIIRQCTTPFYFDEDAALEVLFHDDNAAMPSHNTWNKRQRVAPLICLSPERGEGSSLQSNNAVTISQEPAKVVVPKEPNFTCPVCLNKLVEPSTTKCGHIFCTECIKQAIQFQKKCPTCRKALRKNNFHRIYLPNSDG